MKPSPPGLRLSLPAGGVAFEAGSLVPRCPPLLPGRPELNALIARHQFRDVRAHEKVTIHIVEGCAQDVYPRSNPA